MCELVVQQLRAEQAGGRVHEVAGTRTRTQRPHAGRSGGQAQRVRRVDGRAGLQSGDGRVVWVQVQVRVGVCVSVGMCVGVIVEL